MPIAPYHVIITPVNMNDKSQSLAATHLYQSLMEKGVEVVLDDRDERAGIKFKDADLIGIPIRVTIGPKRLTEGNVEIRVRRSGDMKIFPLQEVKDFVIKYIAEKISCYAYA